MLLQCCTVLPKLLILSATELYDGIKMRRRRAPAPPSIVIQSLQSKCYDLSDYAIILFIGGYTFAELIVKGVRET